MNWIIVIHDHAFAIPDMKVKVSSEFKFLHLFFIYLIAIIPSVEGAVESLPEFLWRIVTEMSARIFFRRKVHRRTYNI
jgi:hypothetical protein